LVETLSNVAASLTVISVVGWCTILLRVDNQPPVTSIAVRTRWHFGGFQAPRSADSRRVRGSRMSARKSSFGSCSAVVVVGILSRSCALFARQLRRAKSRNRRLTGMRFQVKSNLAWTICSVPRRSRWRGTRSAYRWKEALRIYVADGGPISCRPDPDERGGKTNMSDLQKPRHMSTLPISAAGRCPRRRRNLLH